ncbi:hypothetical protein PtA15_1A525 [Puccinia triticina]|uniref:Uncharacterized protein n=1 Tax=Puccinia triticina TaxID=208348 RepID=A0ABY7C7N9_9BASI|nr:uncharacterized protein PtA15_1A525 [Puccinia triticina]WAQ81186.1 hypothetical protein PtA15_1A525 [Puccinia triticina]
MVEKSSQTCAGAAERSGGEVTRRDDSSPVVLGAASGAPLANPTSQGPAISGGNEDFMSTEEGEELPSLGCP